MILAIIDDCRENIHFSRRLFDEQLSKFETGAKNAIDKLNQDIRAKYNESIDEINIGSDIQNLENLANLTPPNVSSQVLEIREPLRRINSSFNNMKSSNLSLPEQLINSTVDTVN